MQSKELLDDFDFNDYSLPAWSDEGEVVGKYYSPLEAELAAARLRSEGIHCFLANTAGYTVNPHLQTVIRLHVRPQDIPKAREILSEMAENFTKTPDTKSNYLGILLLFVIVFVLLATYSALSR